MHQIWLGKNKIPDQFLVWRENWRKLHVDWEYRLWTEEDVKDDKTLSLMSKVMTLSCKSNVLRFYIILQHGGVYSDVDFDWNKNIDEFLINKAIICKQTPEKYNTAIFGAEKGNDWVLFAYNLIEKNYVYRRPPWGALLATQSMENFNDVTILPTEYFYPYLWREAYKDAKLFPQAYAVHHWNMSWSHDVKFKV